jgi:putative membrane protein insertion efficiency factor
MILKKVSFYSKRKDIKRKVKKEGFFTEIIVFLIIVYQYLISPFLGNNCRFIPTCSSYSISAIKKYGFKRGVVLAMKRIFKCHRWNKGGYDPVK